MFENMNNEIFALIMIIITVILSEFFILINKSLWKNLTNIHYYWNNILYITIIIEYYLKMFDFILGKLFLKIQLTK